jgi:hypothetical protein
MPPRIRDVNGGKACGGGNCLMIYHSLVGEVEHRKPGHGFAFRPAMHSDDLNVLSRHGEIVCLVWEFAGAV